MEYNELYRELAAPPSGVFIFPFLNAFPDCRATAIEILPRRVELVEDLRRGGVSRLSALNADVFFRPRPEKSVDAVPMGNLHLPTLHGRDE